MDDLPGNLKRWRKQRDLTQAELATRAGIPRASLAHMEQDGSNPGIQSVMAVAQALGLGVDDLLLPSPEHRFVKVSPREVQEFRAAGNRYVARLVSPLSSKGVQINQVRMLPLCKSQGRPHEHGAQEYYLTLSGTAHLRIAGELVTVEAGALVQFPGHLEHWYENHSKAVETVGISCVVLQLS